MLDDMTTLQGAVERYRDAATAAGNAFPDPAERRENPPPELVLRLFDVDHVAEQLVWSHSLGWNLLPDHGNFESWPTEADARPQFELLSLSAGVPFPWRRQLPLFRWDYIVYTFVLAGEHEGEIWRFGVDDDSEGAHRAAMSLAALFDQWTRAIDLGVLRKEIPDGDWLAIGGGDGGSDWDNAAMLAGHGLDPAAFPVWFSSGYPDLRRWQASCGVDLVQIDRDFEAHEELLDECEAILAEFGL